jgi:integrase
MTVEQAQRRARELQGQIVMGVDPRTAKRKAREEPTLSVLFQFWMDSHAKQHKRTWEADERQYNTYLKPWAGRRLSAINKADVAALQLHIAAQKGRYIANKVLALLRAMFNRAADIGFAGPNPTAGIKKFPEEKRDRFLHGEDLRVFFAALAADQSPDLRDYFLVCLFVGARKSNVLAMQWVDIDLRAGIWRIPETKSGKPVVVPLVGPVMQLLEARRQVSHGSPWVFPSRGKTGHLVEPKSAWKRIIERAGLSDVRPHDLRRSLGSWMAMTGAGLPVVGKMLGHTQPTTTAIYARLSVDPVRQAAEKATDAMLQAGGVQLLEKQ